MVAVVMVASALPVIERDAQGVCGYTCRAAHALTINLHYASRHSYDFLFYLNEGNPLSFRGRHPAWSKVVALAHALFVRNSELALYIDQDAFINNPSISLTTWLRRATAYQQLTSLMPLARHHNETVLSILDNAPYAWDTDNVTGQRRFACTGIMAVRRLAATHCFLSHWWFNSARLAACPIARGPRWSCPDFEVDHDWEQGPLNGVYLMNRTIKRRIAVLSEPSMYRREAVEPRKAHALVAETSAAAPVSQSSGQQYFLHLTGNRVPSMSGRAVIFRARRAGGISRSHGTMEHYDGGRGAYLLLRDALLRGVELQARPHDQAAGQADGPRAVNSQLDDLVRESAACLLANGTGQRTHCKAAGLGGTFEWFALNRPSAVAEVWRRAELALTPARWTLDDRRFCRGLQGLPMLQ